MTFKLPLCAFLSTAVATASTVLRGTNEVDPHVSANDNLDNLTTESLFLTHHHSAFVPNKLVSGEPLEDVDNKGIEESLALENPTPKVARENLKGTLRDRATQRHAQGRSYGVWHAKGSFLR